MATLTHDLFPLLTKTMEQLGKLASLANQHIIQKRLEAAYDHRDSIFHIDTSEYYRTVNRRLNRSINAIPLANVYDGNRHKLASTSDEVPGVVRAYWEPIFCQPDKDIPEQAAFYRCPKYKLKHAKVPVNNPMAEVITTAAILETLTNNPDKASGMDLINKRSLLAGGETVLHYLTDMANAMRLTRRVPRGCKDQLVIFLRKSQAKPATSLDNYRPISLQSCAYKCLQAVLTARAMAHVHGHRLASTNQNGFLPGGNSIKHACAQASVFEHARQFQKQAYCLFLDVRKAFDTTSAKSVELGLERFKFHADYRQFIQCTLKDRRVHLWTAYGQHPDPIISSNSAAQGAVESPLLFISVIDPLLARMAEINTAPYIFSHGTEKGTAADSVRGFADDTSLTCMDAEVFQTMINEVCKAFYLIGLDLNHGKTAIIISPAARARHPGRTFTVNVHEGSVKPSPTKAHTITPLAVGDDPERYLGVFFDENGSTAPTKAIVKASMKRVCDFIYCGNYSVAQAVQMANCLVLARFRYTLPCLSYTLEELQELDVMVRRAMKGAATLPPGTTDTYCYLDGPGLGLFSAQDVYASTLAKELYVDLCSEESPMFLITRLRLLDLQDSLGLYTPVMEIGEALAPELLDHFGPVNRLIHSVQALCQTGHAGHFNRNHPDWQFVADALPQGLISEMIPAKTWLRMARTCIIAKVHYISQVCNNQGDKLQPFQCLANQVQDNLRQVFALPPAPAGERRLRRKADAMPKFTAVDYKALRVALCEPGQRQHLLLAARQKPRVTRTVPLAAVLKPALGRSRTAASEVVMTSCDLKVNDYVIFTPSLASVDARKADRKDYGKVVRKIVRTNHDEAREERYDNRYYAPVRAARKADKHAAKTERVRRYNEGIQHGQAKRGTLHSTFAPLAMPLPPPPSSPEPRLLPPEPVFPPPKTVTRDRVRNSPDPDMWSAKGWIGKIVHMGMRKGVFTARVHWLFPSNQLNETKDSTTARESMEAGPEDTVLINAGKVSRGYYTPQELYRVTEALAYADVEERNEETSELRAEDEDLVYYGTNAKDHHYTLPSRNRKQYMGTLVVPTALLQRLFMEAAALLCRGTVTGIPTLEEHSPNKDDTVPRGELWDVGEMLDDLYAAAHRGPEHAAALQNILGAAVLADEGINEDLAARAAEVAAQVAHWGHHTRESALEQGRWVSTEGGWSLQQWLEVEATAWRNYSKALASAQHRRVTPLSRPNHHRHPWVQPLATQPSDRPWDLSSELPRAAQVPADPALAPRAGDLVAAYDICMTVGRQAPPHPSKGQHRTRTEKKALKAAAPWVLTFEVEKNQLPNAVDVQRWPPINIQYNDGEKADLSSIGILYLLTTLPDHCRVRLSAYKRKLPGWWLALQNPQAMNTRPACGHRRAYSDKTIIGIQAVAQELMRSKRIVGVPDKDLLLAQGAYAVPQPTEGRSFLAPGGGGSTGKWSCPWNVEEWAGAPAFYIKDTEADQTVRANLKQAVKGRLQQRHREVLSTPKYKLLRWLDGVYLSPADNRALWNRSRRDQQDIARMHGGGNSCFYTYALQFQAQDVGGANHHQQAQDVKDERKTCPQCRMEVELFPSHHHLICSAQKYQREDMYVQLVMAIINAQKQGTRSRRQLPDFQEVADGLWLNVDKQADQALAMRGLLLAVGRTDIQKSMRAFNLKVSEGTMEKIFDIVLQYWREAGQISTDAFKRHLEEMHPATMPATRASKKAEKKRKALSKMTKDDKKEAVPTLLDHFMPLQGSSKKSIRRMEKRQKRDRAAAEVAEAAHPTSESYLGTAPADDEMDVEVEGDIQTQPHPNASQRPKRQLSASPEPEEQRPALCAGVGRTVTSNVPGHDKRRSVEPAASDDTDPCEGDGRSPSSLLPAAPAEIAPAMLPAEEVTRVTTGDDQQPLPAEIEAEVEVTGPVRRHNAADYFWNFSISTGLRQLRELASSLERRAVPPDGSRPLEVVKAERKEEDVDVNIVVTTTAPVARAESRKRAMVAGPTPTRGTGKRRRTGSPNQITDDATGTKGGRHDPCRLVYDDEVDGQEPGPERQPTMEVDTNTPTWLEGWQLALESEEQVVTQPEEFPPLSPAAQAMVADAIREVPVPARDENLVRVNVSERSRMELQRGDLMRLRPGKWLGDVVINSYSHLLNLRSANDPVLPKLWCFTSFFYDALKTNGYDGVKKWGNGIRGPASLGRALFDLDLIIVPIHLGSHWCCGVVNFEKKRLELHDSMGVTERCFFGLMRNYLTEEAKKQKVPFNLEGWQDHVSTDSPEQHNGFDCGLFMARYAEYLSRRVPFTFDQSNMPYFRTRMAFEVLTQNLLPHATVGARLSSPG